MGKIHSLIWSIFLGFTGQKQDTADELLTLNDPKGGFHFLGGPMVDPNLGGIRYSQRWLKAPPTKLGYHGFYESQEYMYIYIYSIVVIKYIYIYMYVDLCMYISIYMII